MTASPDAIGILRASHDRLVSLVEPLSAEQVRQRAYPSEWSIAQVLSHLGSGAEINGLVIDAGLTGEDPPARENLSQIWDRWNARSPDEQAADALKSDARLVEQITANADTSAMFPTWMGPTDIQGVAVGRLSEHAVHTWDIAVALDPKATVLPEAVPLLFGVVERLVGFSAKQTDWTGTVHVTTTDPAQEYALTLGEQRSLTGWPGGPADAELSLPAEAFLRLAYGRLDADHTPPDVTTSGITLDDLRAVFPGF